MSAYYNEIDPQKAAWLRELIKRDLIAPGDVDERSIHDVRAEDLRKYAQCHFFAGIGICQLSGSASLASQGLRRRNCGASRGSVHKILHGRTKDLKQISPCGYSSAAQGG